ncbi:hypothetical protein PoB_006680700 [Plakobranchus ocellatus]|uniref:Uncharacterized protein n=1 Tax=Plakobranchus ocellatus TaxID=259542 RepID=A0AAV4D829_9GAST|nr:hypothetical protein PoB_006680700 [Plakobranchus ocellatus]
MVRYLSIRLVNSKVISGFQAFRQARAPVVGLELALEGSLQISRWIRKPLCHQRQARSLQQTFAKSSTRNKNNGVATQRCMPVHNKEISGFQALRWWARPRDRRIPVDIGADSLATVPPTPPSLARHGIECPSLAW